MDPGSFVSSFEFVAGSEGEDGDANWAGIGTGRAGRRAKEEEYSDEEQLAHVTVVEDFDPEELIHGPPPTNGDSSGLAKASGSASGRNSSSDPRPNAIKDERRGLPRKGGTKALAGKSKKKFKYETNAARKAAWKKQKGRQTEKAERAGGKATKKQSLRGRKGR